MKKVILASILALGTSTLLAGCGLIPAIELDDPLALNDAEFVSDTLSDAAIPGSSTRVAGSGKLSVSSTFGDVPASTFTLVPSTFDVSVLMKKAKLSAGCPTTTGIINVSISNFKVKISDLDTRFYDSQPGAVNFTFNAADGAISGLSETALGFSITEIQKAVDILTLAPTPNKVAVSANIVTDPPLKGCKVTFVVGKTKGKIKF